MKTLILIVWGLFSLSPNGWMSDFEQAKQIAKQEKKLILLNFSGSDWCIPCKKLKLGLFSDTTFLNYASSNLVLVNADFPIQKTLSHDQAVANESLAEKYNPEGSFPFTLLLDDEGKVLKTWSGTIDKNAILFEKTIEQLKP